MIFVCLETDRLPFTNRSARVVAIDTHNLRDPQSLRPTLSEWVVIVMLLLQLLIGPLDWTRKIETTSSRKKIYSAKSRTMKTCLDHDSIRMLILASVQIWLRLGPDPDRGPPIEYPWSRSMNLSSTKLHTASFLTNAVPMHGSTQKWTRALGCFAQKHCYASHLLWPSSIRPPSLKETVLKMMTWSLLTIVVVV